MALVTVQRSPSPSNSPESLSSDVGDGDCDGEELDESGQPTPDRSRRSVSARERFKKVLNTVQFVTRIRESYLTVKGAALILPQSECARTVTRGKYSGDIQDHLQSMFYLLRPQDTIKVAVKLESCVATLNRYLAVVSTQGRQDTEESVILGIDILSDTSTVGMVLPVWGDMEIRLDGDGGFSVSTIDRHHIFKPVSVQAMWSALQTLIKVRDIAQQNSYHKNGLTHTWTTYYDARVKSDQMAINEWFIMDDIESHRPDSSQEDQSADKINLETLIKSKLKEIMMTVDLEEVTSKFLRTKLEEHLKRDLRDYRHFIDEEMIIILRQMDSPSEIFEYLYLGSEWNASNLEELRENGVGEILNVTREIDNFFPGMFEYHNVRLWDSESSELMKYWDDTYKFIHNAKERHSKVLVHCKMGVSRSASTVIAFAMKEFGWSLEQAYQHVKSRRSCVKPNSGFMQQLITYQGILDASKQRHNKLWRSVSTGNLGETVTAEREVTEEECEEITQLLQDTPGEGRPRSWSPDDSAAQLLLKAQDLGTDSELSEEDQHETYSENTCYPDTTCKQEAPLSPFLFSIDDWEELDISSRSADSLDDILDVPCPDQKDYDLSMDTSLSHPVVLKSYTLLKDDDAAPPDISDVNIESAGGSMGESDYKDFIAMDMDCKPERGCYDICMLTGHHTLIQALSNDEEEDDENYDGINIWYLHPDTKLETILSHFRKQRRIAQLLKLSQQKEEEENAKIIMAKKAKRKLLAGHQKLIKTNSTPLLCKKVKPDDFWIKEAEDKSDNPVDDGTVLFSCGDNSSLDVSNDSNKSVPQLELETKGLETVEPSDTLKLQNEFEQVQVDATLTAAEMLTPSVREMPPTTAGGNDCQTSPPEGHKGVSSLESTPPRSPGDRSQGGQSPLGHEGQSPQTPNREMGVWQHYEKEAIPWSPGTVKRQTLDLEEKIKTGELIGQTLSSSECSLDNQETISLGQADPSLNIPAINSASAQIEVPVDVNTFSIVTEIETSDSEEFRPSDNVEPAACLISTDNPEVPGSGNAEKRVPLCIYDTEEIALEPGLVRRTKMEFEQRERSSSYADIEGILKEGKPVQRSSSWKNERTTKSKNRESERRRTCLPVLQFSPLISRESSQSREDGSSMHSMEDGSSYQPKEDRSNGVVKEGKTPESAEEVVVLKVGLEDVEMKHGQVRRRTKDFESLTAEEERLLGLLSLPARERARSHSPYVEEGLAILPGSVRRHTKEIEIKYSQEGEPDVQKEDTNDNSRSEIPVDGEGNSVTQKEISSDGCKTPDPTLNLEVSVGKIEEQSVQKASVEESKGTEMKDRTEESLPDSTETDTTMMTLEGVTTDSSSDFEKYQAIREESLPTLLLQGQGEATSLAGEGKGADEVPWRSGIVKQQKEAIENKAKECDPSANGKTSATEGQESPYKMTPELLTLIRRVGSALIDTPKGSPEKPMGSVRKVARDIENRCGHKHFQGRMVIVEKNVACRLDLGSPVRGSTALGRSASLKEKSQSPDKDVTSALVGRSSSLKESVSPGKKLSSEKQLYKPISSHVSSAAITLVTSPKADPHTITTSPGESQKNYVSSAEMMVNSTDDLETADDLSHKSSSMDQGEMKDDRKVVKDLMGFFECKPDSDGSLKKDPILTPPRGGAGSKPASPKSPKEINIPTDEVQARSSSESVTVLSKTSSTKTKSETSKDNLVSSSDRSAPSVSRALKEKSLTVKTSSTKTGKELSPSRNKKGREKGSKSRETSPRSKTAKSKDRSPVAKRSEENSQTKSASTVSKTKSEYKTKTTAGKKFDGQTASSSVTHPKTTDSQSNRQKSSSSLTPPKQAASKVVKDGLSKSPNSPPAKTETQASTSPTASKYSTDTSFSKSLVSRALFPEVEPSERPEQRWQVHDRKASLPAVCTEVQPSSLEPARPRTLSYTSGDSRGQATTTHAAGMPPASVPPVTVKGKPFIPLSPEVEPNLGTHTKTRKAHGKSHPLSKLATGPS